MAMRKPSHSLSEINEAIMTATCVICGPVNIRKKIANNKARGFIYECREKRILEKREQRRKKTEKCAHIAKEQNFVPFPLNF